MSIITVNDKEIAERLNEIIKEKRIKSARAFALSINVDPSYIAKVMKCERSISETMVDAIQDKYKISPDWLLWGKGEKYGQPRPQENTIPITGQLPDTGLKYIALLEKTLNEKEADLKVLRSAVSKITQTDERLVELKSTVDDLQDKFSNLDPIVLGLREYVTDEIASLKKISREAATAALSSKVEAHRKKV